MQGAEDLAEGVRGLGQAACGRGVKGSSDMETEPERQEAAGSGRFEAAVGAAGYTVFKGGEG